MQGRPGGRRGGADVAVGSGMGWSVDPGTGDVPGQPGPGTLAAACLAGLALGAVTYVLLFLR
jgi:hypothetical protein